MKLALLCTAVVLLGHQGYCQDDLDKLRKNIPGEPGKDYPIFGTNILCKINPRNPGCGGGGGGKKGNGNDGGGNGNNGGGSGNNGHKREATRTNGGNAQRGNKASFQDEIAKGNIPGSAGKDYPTNS